MNRRQAQRLLNVATACRETKFPDEFDMGHFGLDCDTPGCALGNYAVRRDLQTRFALDQHGELVYDDGSIAWFSEQVDYFGISRPEIDELFQTNGCGRAKTANEAATYIEGFLADRGWHIAA